MSDSGDDWEKQLEDDGELEQQLKQAEEEKKRAAFKDEDAYDSEEERKKKKAEAANQPAPEKKEKQRGGQKDYDKMFEERLVGAKTGGANNARIEEIKKSNLSQEAKAQQLQIAADADITEALFADLNVNANSLNQEKDYINFGKKVSTVLYEGQAPYRIPQFFKELVRDLSKQIYSKKIKEILDSVTAIYNEKVKEEKEKEKGGKGAAGKNKATLKSGKQHLNQQLVSNLMGEDDDDEYGEEGYQRAKEEDYDFM